MDENDSSLEPTESTIHLKPKISITPKWPHQERQQHATVNSPTATALIVTRNLSPLPTKLTTILKTTDLLSVESISDVYIST
jgi:hypothetical protein